MKKQIVALVLGIALVGGVGAGIAANALSSDDPTDRPAAGSQLFPVKDLVIKPGAVGSVRVGMSKEDAFSTGYLVPGKSSVDGCPTPALAWRKAYAGTLDVQTFGNGEISSIGIRAAGPHTAEGFGVGTTLGELESAGIDPPVEAGYGQSGAFQVDDRTGAQVGYLFAEAPLKLTAKAKVIFVEVTKGAQPSLMRDGC